MTSNKPYLIRALYEWMADNNLTPYLLTKANSPYCIVPQEYVKNGEIVLDISMEAVDKLLLGNDAIEFKARFSGKVREIYVPISAVKAFYAAENGQGMAFPEEESGDDDEGAQKKPLQKGKPHLKIVE